MDELLKVLPDLVQSGVTDLHIYPGEKCFVRRGGTLEELTGITFSEDAVKKIILGTSSSRARELLGRLRQVNYSSPIQKIGRFRFSAFFDKDRFALAIRFLPEKLLRWSEIGLPEGLKKVLSATSGLVIVASPSGQGKTTTIGAILDFFNCHFQKNVITIENPVEIQFRDDRCSFIQRSIPLDVGNFCEGLKEAYRLEPDIVMTDSINYRDAMDQSLFLCESGRMVIGATDGGNCRQIIERFIYSRALLERENLRGKLATHLSAIISQRLVPKADRTGRVAVFDILVNTPAVKKLIKNDNLVMFKSVQEQDQSSGMQVFDQHLATLARKNVISSAIAIEYAEDGHEMMSRFGRTIK